MFTTVPFVPINTRKYKGQRSRVKEWCSYANRYPFVYVTEASFNSLESLLQLYDGWCNLSRKGGSKPYDYAAYLRWERNTLYIYKVPDAFLTPGEVICANIASKDLVKRMWEENTVPAFWSGLARWCRVDFLQEEILPDPVALDIDFEGQVIPHLIKHGDAAKWRVIANECLPVWNMVKVIKVGGKIAFDGAACIAAIEKLTEAFDFLNNIPGRQPWASK